MWMASGKNLLLRRINSISRSEKSEFCWTNFLRIISRQFLKSYWPTFSTLQVYSMNWWKWFLPKVPVNTVIWMFMLKFAQYFSKSLTTEKTMNWISKSFWFQNAKNNSSKCLTRSERTVKKERIVWQKSQLLLKSRKKKIKMRRTVSSWCIFMMTMRDKSVKKSKCTETCTWLPSCILQDNWTETS